MSITGLDHVQVACPAGSESVLRDFYGEVLGLPEVAKPAALARRGGVWFQVGTQQLHCGVEADFVPARKAHPAFCATELDALAALLQAAGAPVRWDEGGVPGVRRFHTEDPFGNRVEILEHVGEGESPV